MSNICVEA